MHQKTRPPIGSIAVQKGFVTSQQVEYALNLQRQRLSENNENIRLGELLSELGYLDSKQFSELDSTGSFFDTLSEDAIRLAVQVRSDIECENNIVFMTGITENDGVSTVAYQVALAFATMDFGKVLYLDSNFRSPFSRGLIDNAGDKGHRDGLADFLLDKIPFEKALTPNLVSKLDFMGTGDIAVDFYSLLLSDKFGNMLEKLKNEYALILIDAPPILQYSEATAIAQRADKAIIVVRNNTHSQKTIREAINVLHTLKVPFLGAILFDAGEKNNFSFPSLLSKLKKK